MEVIALKTFDGKYGLIRTGIKLTVDDAYGRSIVRNGLAKVHVPLDLQPKPVPEQQRDAPQNASLPGAPRPDPPPNPPRAATARRSRGGESTASTSGRRRAGGRATQLLSPPPDPASTKPI